jgi:hypothetical protein
VAKEVWCSIAYKEFNFMDPLACDACVCLDHLSFFHFILFDVIIGYLLIIIVETNFLESDEGKGRGVILITCVWLKKWKGRRDFNSIYIWFARGVKKF